MASLELTYRQEVLTKQPCYPKIKIDYNKSQNQFLELLQLQQQHIDLKHFIINAVKMSTAKHTAVTVTILKHWYKLILVTLVICIF